MQLIQSIKRDGTDVVIEVNTGLQTSKPIFYFRFSCENEENAELLKRHLYNHFTNNFRELRRKTYMQGWEHGKDKRRKNPDTWFSNFLGE